MNIGYQGPECDRSVRELYGAPDAVMQDRVDEAWWRLPPRNAVVPQKKSGRNAAAHFFRLAALAFAFDELALRAAGAFGFLPPRLGNISKALLPLLGPPLFEKVQQPLQRKLPVLKLRTTVRRRHRYLCGDMPDRASRAHFIDVLATRPGRTGECLHEILPVDSESSHAFREHTASFRESWLIRKPIDCRTHQIREGFHRWALTFPLSSKPGRLFSSADANLRNTRAIRDIPRRSRGR